MAPSWYRKSGDCIPPSKASQPHRHLWPASWQLLCVLPCASNPTFTGWAWKNLRCGSSHFRKDHKVGIRWAAWAKKRSTTNDRSQLQKLCADIIQYNRMYFETQRKAEDWKGFRYIPMLCPQNIKEFGAQDLVDNHQKACFSNSWQVLPSENTSNSGRYFFSQFMCWILQDSFQRELEEQQWIIDHKLRLPSYRSPQTHPKTIHRVYVFTCFKTLFVGHFVCSQRCWTGFSHAAISVLVSVATLPPPNGSDHPLGKLPQFKNRNWAKLLPNLGVS